MEQFGQFHQKNFHLLCDGLSEKDTELGGIMREYGYPPFWTRTPGFATLIHIILEQQVSLASAKAAFEKLKQKLGTITPKKLLQLSDSEMKACYFSRQKTRYARELAKAIVTKQLDIEGVSLLPDDEVRKTLKQVKGIGDWTVDVYLIFALQRTDIFPTGDLAMISAFRELKQLPKETNREEILLLAEKWRPHRSVATMMLWHFYIRKRNIRF